MATTAIGSIDAFVHDDPVADRAYQFFRFVPPRPPDRQWALVPHARPPKPVEYDATPTDPSGPPCTGNCITRQFCKDARGGTCFDLTVTSADHPMAFTRCQHARGLRPARAPMRFNCENGRDGGYVDVGTDPKKPYMRICERTLHDTDPGSAQRWYGGKWATYACVHATGLMDDHLVPYDHV